MHYHCVGVKTMYLTQPWRLDGDICTNGMTADCQLCSLKWWEADNRWAESCICRCTDLRLQCLEVDESSVMCERGDSDHSLQPLLLSFVNCHELPYPVASSFVKYSSSYFFLAVFEERTENVLSRPLLHS